MIIFCYKRSAFEEQFVDAITVEVEANAEVNSRCSTMKKLTKAYSHHRLDHPLYDHDHYVPYYDRYT